MKEKHFAALPTCDLIHVAMHDRLSEAPHGVRLFFSHTGQPYLLSHCPMYGKRRCTLATGASAVTVEVGWHMGGTDAAGSVILGIAMPASTVSKHVHDMDLYIDYVCPFRYIA